MPTPLLLQVEATEAEAFNPAVGALLMVLAAAVYLLPAIVGRKKRNSNAITLLNVFLGWTFLGWIVALVWATSNDAPPARIVQKAPQASVADELHKLKVLHDMGALSDTEFTQEKQRLLRQA